ncbi:MAG TPA: DUF1552 domain-containing protein [Polyangiaceae bacterium]|jgi:hypothetical protein
MKRSASRRTFIRAVGAGFATLPFFRLLEDSFAQSTGEELPLKFVTMYHPHGLCAEYWAMQAGDTETAFDLRYENCSLYPFDDPDTYGKSFKDRILVVEGVDHLSNANGHDSAGTILTGSRIDASKKPQNTSLDQFLAVERGFGASTRVTSVALGVGNDSAESGTTLSFGAGGEPLPKIIDPVKAFDLLFSGVVVGDDPEAIAQAERNRRLGQSVIDFVREDIDRLKPRLAYEERLKLDQHLTSLSELEKQLAAGGPGGPSCMVPERPGEFSALKQYNGGEPFFDAITDAHIDVLAQALACGLTRFATLFMNDLSYASNPLGLPEDNHGEVAHKYNASPIGHNNNPVGSGDPATWLPLARFNRYSYSKVARLMQKLDELGALESTLIYAASDMGNPNLHSTRNVPTVLAGGANGKFRMGRRIKLPLDCPENNSWCPEDSAEFTGVPNNRILVSIAQAFGVEVDSFGTQANPAFTTGTLSELL